MGPVSQLARRTAARFLPHFAHRLACAGCRRPPARVAALLAGPDVYLCGDCFERAVGQVAPRRAPPTAVRCPFCRQRRAAVDVAHVGGAAVCADCLGVMAGILAEARHPSRPAT